MVALYKPSGFNHYSSDSNHRYALVKVNCLKIFIDLPHHSSLLMFSINGKVNLLLD